MRVFLGLGSNMGDRKANLMAAIEAIGQLPCTGVEAVSSVMETEPEGEWEQRKGLGRTQLKGAEAAGGKEAIDRNGGGKFLNCCVRISTGIPPRELLRRVKEIEMAMGRTQKPIKKNGAGQRIYSDRPIDIDILLYGRRRIDEPDLQIPHPRMTERDFVLRPLREIL